MLYVTIKYHLFTEYKLYINKEILYIGLINRLAISTISVVTNHIISYPFINSAQLVHNVANIGVRIAENVQ